MRDWEFINDDDDDDDIYIYIFFFWHFSYYGHLSKACIKIALFYKFYFEESSILFCNNNGMIWIHK
jgi:hypothetical protein